MSANTHFVLSYPSLRVSLALAFCLSLPPLPSGMIQWRYTKRGKERRMATASPISRTTVGRAMEVLLVEDNLADARITLASLKAGSIPCRVTLVLDGEEALRFCRRDGEFRRAAPARSHPARHRVAQKGRAGSPG